MSAGPPLAERVAQALGPGLAQADEQALAAFALDGRPPRAVVAPQTPEQVAALLALARTERWSVVPWGAGARVACGGALPRYDVALSLGRLGRLLDHDVENLTVTAEAGLSLAEANRALAPHHQVLCLGHAESPETLGGVIAAAPVAPKRLLYGDVRDQVLGVRVALPDGTLVRYGRKVLKNVAGYDMNKLFLGSQGLLGVVVEATCKLFALPDEEGYLLGAFPGLAEGAACAAALFGSRLLPSLLALLDGSAATQAYGALHQPAPAGAVHLLAGFEGRGVTLRRQLAEVGSLMSRQGATKVTEAARLSAGLREAVEQAAPGEDPRSPAAVRLRLGVLPTQVEEVWRQTEAALDGLGLPRTLTADFGAGQVRVALAEPEPQALGPLAAAIAETRRRLAETRGFLVLEAAPPALKAQAPAWGDLGEELALMRTIKTRFDPDGVLNPGRFLGAGD